MLTELSQRKLLEKILASREFCGSKIYAAYLTYLYEASQSGKNLKETTIAIEFFGKGADFNPAEDTIVRTHTYNLRKKLQNYYYEEGKNDKFRLWIPKGHYTINFMPVTEAFYHPRKLLYLLKKNYKAVISIVLAFLLLITVMANLRLRNTIKSYQIVAIDDPLWQDYLQSKLPVMIVVGDHFFFSEYSEKYKSNIVIRHGKINSIEDLDALQAQYPTSVLKPADEPYFPYHSIWTLPPVLNMLFGVGQKPVLRKSSSVIPSVLEEYNLIYLGSIKTLYILKHTLMNSHFKFQILPHIITYINGDTVKTFQTPLHSPGTNEDLVLALKLPGPINNSIFIIASYHSLGAPEVVNHLIQKNMRDEIIGQFLTKYGYMPRYFEILFQVSGIDKTAYKAEMLIFNEIHGNPSP